MKFRLKFLKNCANSVHLSEKDQFFSEKIEIEWFSRFHVNQHPSPPFHAHNNGTRSNVIVLSLVESARGKKKLYSLSPRKFCAPEFAWSCDHEQHSPRPDVTNYRGKTSAKVHPRWDFRMRYTCLPIFAGHPAIIKFLVLFYFCPYSFPLATVFIFFLGKPPCPWLTFDVLSVNLFSCVFV